MSFFVGTFYWIALTNPIDSSHREVLRFTASLPPRSVITTDEVLTEFLAFGGADQRLRRQAGLAVEGLVNDPDIRVIPQSRSTFFGGLALYNERSDKAYSLTDCISMGTMRRERLTEVLTNDKHFDQEGSRAVFRVVPSSSSKTVDGKSVGYRQWRDGKNANDGIAGFLENYAGMTN